VNARALAGFVALALALCGCASGPRVRVEYAPGELQLSRERLQRWVDESVAIVSETCGRFPVPLLELTIQPRGRERGIRDGTTRSLSDRAEIEVGVGGRAGERALERDWVLVHEMLHLSIPNLPPMQHWFEEGLATYLEPLARARGGKCSETEVWRERTARYAQGLPRPGEGGLDDTRTWARTYYGGALFCLVADVRIARASGGAKSLREALAGTVARGRSILESSELSRFARELDAAIGVEVVAPLYAEWAHAPVEVDLEGLWRELGVVRDGDSLRFDESAPLAAWRASLVRMR